MAARTALRLARNLALLTLSFAVSARAAESETPPLLIAQAGPMRAQPPITARPVSPEPSQVAPAQRPEVAPTETAPQDEPPPLIAAGPLRRVEAADGFGPAMSAPAAAVPAAGHPVGILVGLSGVQQPLHAELVVRPVRGLAATVGVGGLPAPLGGALLSAAAVQGGTLSSWSLEAGLQVFPFGGSFFLGATTGHLSLAASAPTKSGTVTFDISSFYVTPHFGWLAIWDSGFSLGFDLGAQLPFSTSVETSGPRRAASNVDNLAHALAGLPLPTLSLKLGWML